MELKPIKVGDKVFTADGRSGKVVCETEENPCSSVFELRIRFDDGTEGEITGADYENGFKNFYLIGKNLFGNKLSVEEMENRIAEQRAVCQVENEKLDKLRKQLWTLNERMVPDWRERLAAKKAKEKTEE